MTTATDIHGIVKPGYEKVREAFARNFEQHGEVGAALSLVVNGEPVVDIWGGYADGAQTRSWERDTIVNVYSTTKGITTVCALRLVEEGKLDLDAPVAQYWPEFAQNGKENIPVRWMLSHRAGLPAVDNIIPLERSFEWEALTVPLAAQKPWWEPGTAYGYHALTFGHLVGEVIRRVTGKTVGAYWREEFAEPLDLDFQIGFGPEDDARTAETIPAPIPVMDPGDRLAKALMDVTSKTFKAFMVSPLPMVNPLYMNSREWRAGEFPAANGHTTARALSALYGALATDGTLDGKTVLKPETIEMATEEQSYGECEVTFFPLRIGVGFMLDIPEFPISPSGKIFGHGGMGGSFGYADPDARFGVGYVMNKMQNPNTVTREDLRWRGMFDAIYASV